ncbi:MAG TPA: hypothetical protein VK463_14475 [Desulfomonilaceae bacterium]|nr:hypothetical protein [Desulfomonilaceae bacterium]
MEDHDSTGRSPRASSGPLRVFRDEDGQLYVTGFGLWFRVATEQEGCQLIAELEDQGYRMCT